MTIKHEIIQRLFEKELITFEESLILSEKEVITVPYEKLPQPQQPSYPTAPYIPSYPDPMVQWAQEEMKKRINFAENCSCNPKNGGSGICGCVLTGPVIYCSAQPVNKVTLGNATFTVNASNTTN